MIWIWQLISCIRAIPKRSSQSRIERKDAEHLGQYRLFLKQNREDSGYPTYGGSIVTVKFASPLQNIRLTAEENDVIKKSSNIMNEAYTRKNHPDSAYAPNGSLDSSGVRPTAPHPASIPAVLVIFALCCCSAGYAVIGMKRERSS